MRNIRRSDDTRRERWLQTALDLVRADDAATQPPIELYHRVMRIWDIERQRRATRRPVSVWLPVAAGVVLALAWPLRGDRAASVATDPQVVYQTEVEMGSDAVLSAQVFMEDAMSLQYVRLRLRPEHLAELGIPILGATDDRAVAVEALIGLDGVPRAIRRAHFMQEPQ